MTYLKYSALYSGFFQKKKIEGRRNQLVKNCSEHANIKNWYKVDMRYDKYKNHKKNK